MGGQFPLTEECGDSANTVDCEEGVRMTTLITGGTGFIGAYVSRRLVRKGERVVTFDNLPSNVIHQLLTPEELAEVTFATGEVTSLADLGHAIREHGVDRVLHLASLLHPVCDQNPPKAIEVNLQGQATVLEAARLFDLKKVVWASSVVVYGARSSHSQKVLPNDAPHHPVSVYGATKSFAEYLAGHYRRTWNVDTLGLRLTLVYGPGRVRGATAFVNELLMKPPLGEKAVVPFGDDVVDWQYVEDVAALMERCLAVPRTETAVFNTQFDPRSLREAGRWVQRVLPDADIQYQPGVFGIAWELDDSQLQKEIGFSPEYPMERGTLEVINFVRRSAGLPPVAAPDTDLEVGRE